MAYLGAQPNKTLTKTTSQSFNGTGSATTFTLNRAVNTEEELEVFVENVQQEPGSGKSYTASGTTLTFDEAPPSGTGNIYVIYRGLAEVTTRLEHDANQALSATTGTFSSDGAFGSTSKSFTQNQIITATTGIGELRFSDTTANAGFVKYEHTADNMIFATDTTERMRISSGNVGINNSAFENTNGVELNIKGGTNNSKPAVVTLQGGSSNGAGYAQTEVFGIAGVTSASEITRITGTGANGLRMLIFVTVTGHTGSLGNGHHIGSYYWDGGTNAVQGVQIDQASSNAPSVTFDNSTSNICIVKLASGNGTGSFNGVMEVRWYVPIDFASNTWQVS
jgi:hypothetical protein